MRVSLIIPALNEAACLPALLAELDRSLIHELIVVDNGSTDGTAEVAQQCGARVVVEARRGYGYACAAGMMASSGDVIAFMDGDGSFVPAELTALLAPIVQGEAGLVVGSRYLGGLPSKAMPVHQMTGNRFGSWLLRRLYGLPLTDLGPFRAIQRDLLLALEMREHTYGWPVEMIVKSARQGARIVEVPVSYRPRSAGKSKVGGTLRGTLLATYRILAIILRYVR